MSTYVSQPLAAVCPVCAAPVGVACIEYGGGSHTARYDAAAATSLRPVHLVAADGDAACGATLLPETTPTDWWDWSDERADVTCTDCAERADEQAFDQQEDRGYSAEDYAADRAVEVSRGIL